jgi:hypothetical protein
MDTKSIQTEREFPDAIFDQDYIFIFLELETIFTEEFENALRTLSKNRPIKLIRYDNLEPTALKATFSFTTDLSNYMTAFKKEVLTDYFEKIPISPYQITEKGLLEADELFYCLILRKFGVAILAFTDPSLGAYFEKLSIKNEEIIPFFQSQLGDYLSEDFISKLKRNWNIHPSQ